MEKLLLLVLLIAAFTGIVYSQPAVSNASQQGILYLKFLDSGSGGGVAPDRIEVDGVPVKFRVEAGSLVVLSLSNGTHKLNVEAADYHPMEFSANLSGTDTPVIEVELDRAVTEESNAVAEDAAVLEGHVTDADTGALLRGASVALPDAQQTTVTEANGYYRFEVVVGDTGQVQQPAVTLEVEAEGFRTLRMKNVALAAGERRRLPVRLTRNSTTATLAGEPVVIDENARAGHLRTMDWTFDVTIR